jgi:ubiquinone/menaquinone biosynthesis C-methylase UbiE
MVVNDDPWLITFYENSFAERERLDYREGQLEFVRTKELLDRFLPKFPVKIIDIGGGTGRYAAWLASQGHNLHLVDRVPAHVEEASRAGAFTVAVGDARDLRDPDSTYDVALLLGPLYHLQAVAERLKALREARRVVREGGIVVAAFISRGAVALDGYVKGWIDKPGTIEIIGKQLREGFVRTGRSGFGEISYFHLPSEASAELKTSGLETLAIYGVEGPGWVAPNFDQRWQQPGTRQVMLESARICEDDPELQVLSAHLLAFCRCPEST